MSFAIFAELFGEQRGKILVKCDQILGVFPTLKLVLDGAHILDR
jgi:hypothetical protein